MSKILNAIFHTTKVETLTMQIARHKIYMKKHIITKSDHDDVKQQKAMIVTFHCFPINRRNDDEWLHAGHRLLVVSYK